MVRARKTAEKHVKSHGRVISAGEPHVFHCNHYNYWLQKTVLLVKDPQMEQVLKDAAAAIAYDSVIHAAKEMRQKGSELMLQIAADAFAAFGFGTLDWSGFSADGGEVATPSSHYGQLLFSSVKKGTFARAQNLFDEGYIAGAAAAAFALPLGSFTTDTLSCFSMGALEGRIIVKRQEVSGFSLGSPGEGQGSGKTPPPPFSNTNIDENSILNALMNLDFSGNEEGFIPRFGVMLTFHWANYYNRISFEFLRKMRGSGMVEHAKTLLVDAGHHCAFNTFGGIMMSPEWNAVIKPMCKTREDWVHGMVATINVLGWGTWRVQELSNRRLVLRIYDDYESRGYLGMYGKSEEPISFLAQGGGAGLMNLLYNGDIMLQPTLDIAYYDQIFDAKACFTGRQTRSTAMGDDFTEVVVER